MLSERMERYLDMSIQLRLLYDDIVETTDKGARCCTWCQEEFIDNTSHYHGEKCLLKETARLLGYVKD